MRWHWSRSVAASPGQVLQPGFGGQVSFWVKKISTLRTRSSKFLMLAYLTKGWGRVGFLCFVATELRYGAAPKDENVENQTN